MKLHREEDIDKLLHAIADVIEHRDLSKMPKAPKPIEITEEEIEEIFKSRARASSADTDGNVYYSDLPASYFNEVALMILSKLK